MDPIDRAAVLDALDEQIKQCDRALNSFNISMKDEYAVKVERASLVAFRETLKYMPSVQPVAKDINVSCKDAISRQDAIDAVDKLSDKPIGYLESAIDVLVDLPSVQPHTDEEIQKIQELEQTQLDKAFELGKESARAEIIHCGECKHKGTKNCVANVWAAILGVTVKDDFYCGLAERRTDERSN